MDIFIPVGQAYTPENQNFVLPDYGELRYTLRSIVKHLSRIDNVFLIFGTNKLPTWLDTLNVRIGFFADLQRPEYKELNIHKKTLKAFDYSSEFLFMNDDHFLLQDFDAEDFPVFCGRETLGELHARMRGRSAYKVTVENTIELIGHKAIFYDLHCPIVFEKDCYVETFANVNLLKHGGYCLKSVYGHNVFEYDWGVPMDDCKIHGIESEERIRERIAGRPFFSTAANAFGPGMLNVLDELYPQKSIFEK